MELKTGEILSSLTQNGARLTLISLASAIVLGVVDQFTSKIIPSTADYIHDLFRPPQFYVSFTPPVDVSGGLTVSLLPATHDIAVRETVTGTHVFTALAGPGTYLLRLRGGADKSGKELVVTKKIEKTGDTWQVDATERNWANATELKSGPPPLRAAAPSNEPVSPGVNRLSNTRWTVTEQDFGILTQIENKVLRTVLATALTEVGVYGDGTDWEKQRIISYWEAAGPEWSTRVQQHVPWGGAFVAWVVKQTHLVPPSGAASYLSWRQWGGDVPLASLKPGMIGIFKIDNSEVPQAGSRLLVGPIVRRQPTCIEVIIGNISNRVVITCVTNELLIAVRSPDQ